MNRSLTNVRNTLTILLTGAVLTFLLIACGSTSVEQLRIPLAVTGTPDMNSGGNAAVVRIYQLSSRSNFRQAPIESFWRDDEAALGDDLVVPRTQILLYPEDEEALELEIHEATRFIGVAVDFRDPEADYWRHLFAVEELQETEPFVLRVGERRLLIAAMSE